MGGAGGQGCRAPRPAAQRGAAFCSSRKYQALTCAFPGLHLDADPVSFRRDPELCIFSAAAS